MLLKQQEYAIVDQQPTKPWGNIILVINAFGPRRLTGQLDNEKFIKSDYVVHVGFAAYPPIA